MVAAAAGGGAGVSMAGREKQQWWRGVQGL